MSVGRRTFLGALAASACVAATRVARADTTVPVRLQAQLIAKLGSFDRSFAERVGNLARVLVVFKAGDADSTQAAQTLASALTAIREVGGVSAVVTTQPFAGARELAATCRSTQPAMVYLSTGLDAEMDGVGKALVGVRVLTIGATASFADRGVIVAFDLEGGRPKLVVNVERAKAQGIVLKAELLRLARIVG